MEQWKSVAEFNGIYEVSNMGRVRRTSPQRIIAQKKQGNGYMSVHLSIHGKTFFRLVHRLVALAFVENRNNHPQINHINEDKTDNRAENIEWCSGSYNCKYGHRNDAMIESRRRPVVQMDLHGNIINTFAILNEAGRKTGISPAHICDVCNGKRNTAGGYIWKYSTT